MRKERGARLAHALRKRYRVERTLGAGGMATVYLAEDLKHRRQVAIKLLDPEVAAQIGSERFLAEIATMAALQHPNILPLFDSGDADGLLYYVMPYVDGESLQERLERETRLPIEEAVRIARAVAGALHSAHRQGVIHRDIKPANILVQAGEPLIADFGIALATAATGDDRMTRTGMRLGTPRYMSPEQIAGERDVGPPCDVYGLGGVLYEMLTGQPPHGGPDAHAVMVRALTEEPTRPRVLRPSIPEGLDATVMRSLATVPTDRFPTAGAFAEALDRSSRTVEQPVPTTREPVERGFRLTAEVCRGLDRSEFDPGMIGDSLQYLDNEADSRVLVYYVHGFGRDQRLFHEVLETSPFRGLAPTLYGFERESERRSSPSFADQAALLRRFVADTRAAISPSRTLVVGFSSGADLLFRAISAAPEWGELIDGFLALSCNLSLQTCFVTGIFSQLESGSGSEILPHLKMTGAGADTLGEWLNVHEYLVTTLRKFEGDFAPLRRHAREVVDPFTSGEPVFPGWYRAVAPVCQVRCVFADTELEREAVQQVLLDHLDTGALGERYREDAISIERGADHFDLIAPRVIHRHVTTLLEQIGR